MVKDLESVIQTEIAAEFTAPIDLYEFTPNRVIVTSGVNDEIDFIDSGSTTRNATLTAGNYSTQAFSAHMKAIMETATGTSDEYTIKYDARTFLFTISSDGDPFTIRWKNGANASTNCAALLGYSILADDSGATEYESDQIRQSVYNWAAGPYDITFGGITYSAMGIAKDNIIQNLGQSFDRVTVSYPNADTAMNQILSTVDFRGARVRIKKVFPLVDLTAGMEIESFVGTVEQISGDEGNISFEIASKTSNLRAEIPAGMFTPSCRWKGVNDSRCGALNTGPLDQATSAAGDADGTYMLIKAVQAFPFDRDNQFQNGYVLFLDGDNEGVIRHITKHTDSSHKCIFDRPTEFIVADNTKYRIWPVCNKIYDQDCRDKFFRDQVVGGTLTSNGTQSTMIASALTNADDYWNDGWVEFTGGSNSGEEKRRVTDFDAASDTVTFDPPVPIKTAIGDTYDLFIGNTERFGGFRDQIKQAQQTQFAYTPGD